MLRLWISSVALAALAGQQAVGQNHVGLAVASPALPSASTATIVPVQPALVPASNGVPTESGLPPAGSLRILPGTIVELMVVNEVTTRNAKVGDQFTLRLHAPVAIGDKIVLPVGTTAVGEITSADPSGMVGHAGKLSARLLYLDVGGVHVPLSGERENAGEAGTLQVVLATVALTPWGLFARGNHGKLKAGDIITGVIEKGYPEGSATEISIAIPVLNRPGD